MRQHKRVLLAVGIAALVAGGCGSSSKSEDTTAAGTAASTAAADAGSADVSAAKAAVAPYVGQASPAFPVDTPLKAKPAADLKISQLQYGTPYGALFASLVDQAGKTAGIDVHATKVGNTASGVQAAAESVLSYDPKAMILPAAEPSTISKQLQEMKDRGIKVFSAGVMDPQKWGIAGSQLQDEQVKLVGKLLADWAVAEHGDDTNAVFYELTELSFNAPEKQAFVDEMQRICPKCTVRTVPMSVTEVGTKVPNNVVSDLQTNADTNVAVFAGSDSIVGVPAALKSAGIDVSIIGFAGDPTTFQYIKDGSVDAVLAISPAVQSWTLMDMALRSAQGQELTAGEQNGITPMQFLTQKDITFDPSKGWASDPDFVQTFSDLWHVG
jgi:ribose transport system substrate-binding protein